MTIELPASEDSEIILTTFKRYLVSYDQRINLHTLVHEEAGRLIGHLTDERFPVSGPALQQSELTATYIRDRISKYEGVARTLQDFLIYGCFFGDDCQHRLWSAVLQRIAQSSVGNGGYTILTKLRLYTALLLLYSGGIGAVAEERFQALASLFSLRVKVDGNNAAAAQALIPQEVLEWDQAKTVFGANTRYHPLSAHLFEVLREPTRQCLPDEAEYRRCFDLFEYMLGLAYTDLYTKQGHDAWGPIGVFTYRYGMFAATPWDQSPQMQVETAISTMGESWPPLRYGLFDGSIARLREVKVAYDAFLKRVAANRW